MALRRELIDTVETIVQRYKTDLLTKEDKAAIEKDVDAFLVLEIRRHGDPGILEHKAEEMEKRKKVLREVNRYGRG